MKPVAKLRFSLHENETPTSFASRFSRYFGLDSVNDFCLDQGFRWQELIAGDDFAVDALARIAGEDPGRLRKWAIRNRGARRFSIAGFPAPRNAIRRTQIRLCPECLQEDRAKHGPNGAYRRYFWQLSAIRTCATHSGFLMDLPLDEYTILNYDFASKVEEHRQIIDYALLHAGEIRRNITAYEQYILQRIDGNAQLPFLDDLPLDVACKLYETLGCVMLYGRDRKLRTVREHEFCGVPPSGGKGHHAHASCLFPRCNPPDRPQCKMNRYH